MNLKNEKKKGNMIFLKKVIVYFMLSLGSLLVAVSIDLFLAPNGMMDGGITGISIMAEELFGVPLSYVLFGLNMPILALTGRVLGKKFTVRSFYSNLLTVFLLNLLHGYPPVTESDLLMFVYGGVILGLGVGIVVRFGGAIDGFEMVAVWANEKYNVSISTFLLISNAFVIVASIFVFNLESAMFSFIIFFLVTKIIDIVEVGFNQNKSIMIISDRSEEIGKEMLEQMGEKVSLTYFYGKGGYSGQELSIIYCIANRFLYNKVKEIALTIDESSIIEVSDVSEANGINHFSPGKHLMKKK